MFTAIIIDDNEADRMYLGKLLQDTGNVKILAEAASGLLALDLASRLRPDIAFLDIEMPGQNGMEIAKELLTIYPQVLIVFFTAHRDFAVEAFAINSADYLLKPFDAFRVRKTLAKIQEKLASRQLMNKLDSQGINKLAIKSKGEIFLIDLNQVVFIEKNDKNTTTVHTLPNNFTTTQTLGELEKQLAGFKHFQRVHKSYLINLNMVQKICPFADNSFEVKFEGYKETAIISRRHIDLVKRCLNMGKLSFFSQITTKDLRK